MTRSGTGATVRLRELTRVADPAAGTTVSVLVPVTERPGPLDRLYREVSSALQEAGRTFEFVFAAEPWARSFLEPLRELAEAGEPIRLLEAGQTMGESLLLDGAAATCRSPVLLILPSYPRIQADGVLDLLGTVEEGGADLATARRTRDEDALLNRIRNRAFHFLLRRGVAGGFDDVASGVRAVRREVLEEIPLYGDFYRFLPVLARREGFDVREVPVAQHPEDARVRHYGFGVYLRRLLDLLGLAFLVRFTQKPLRFFGLIGSFFAFGGALILLVLLIQRLGGQGIADRPLLLLGALLFVLGAQSVALGLVGEIIVHLGASHARSYRTLDDGPETRAPRTPSDESGGSGP